MVTIKGIYDGKKIELLEEVPFREKKNVVVTFLDEVPENTDMLPSDIAPIEALKGCARGSNLTEKLLESRRKDLELEEAKWRK